MGKCKNKKPPEHKKHKHRKLSYEEKCIKAAWEEIIDVYQYTLQKDGYSCTYLTGEILGMQRAMGILGMRCKPFDFEKAKKKANLPVLSAGKFR